MHLCNCTMNHTDITAVEQECFFLNDLHVHWGAKHFRRETDEAVPPPRTLQLEIDIGQVCPLGWLDISWKVQLSIAYSGSWHGSDSYIILIYICICIYIYKDSWVYKEVLFVTLGRWNLIQVRSLLFWPWRAIIKKCTHQHRSSIGSVRQLDTIIESQSLIDHNQQESRISPCIYTFHPFCWCLKHAGISFW